MESATVRHRTAAATPGADPGGPVCRGLSTLATTHEGGRQNAHARFRGLRTGRESRILLRRNSIRRRPNLDGPELMTDLRRIDPDPLKTQEHD